MFKDFEDNTINCYTSIVSGAVLVLY
jgi:hypothetical protein